MLSINRIAGYYHYPYCQRNTNEQVQIEINSDNSSNCDKEIITTWRFDEEGNIVYYKLDKKTGNIISKTVYKNPNKIKI